MKLHKFAGSIAAGLVVGVASSHANVISVSTVNGNLYQQTVQNPCIFSNPSCQQPGGFAATAVPNQGNVNSWDLLSPVYAGSQLLGFLGANALQLGLDINQASGQGPQTLSGFQMIKNGNVVDTFTGPLNVPAGNNGNGYADYILSNFSAFTGSDTIQFRFQFNNANDGAENVFLITGQGGGGPPNAVPVPGTLLLLGLGLFGLGFARRRV